MADWGIERQWLVKRGEDRYTTSTEQLLDLGVCCILGAAGLGKTHELNSLAKSLQESGACVVQRRLVDLSIDLSGPSLRDGLKELSEELRGSPSDTVLMLDALDEAMIPIRRIDLIVSEWIKRDLSDIRRTLLIACRSTVWPEEIRIALADAYQQDVSVAILQPLSREHQEAAIAAERLGDSDAFFQAVAANRVETLVAQPMTLRLLIDEFRDSGAIATDRCELFRRAVHRLVCEREERQETADGNPYAPARSPAELLDAAEKIACLLLLSDHRAVSLGDDHVKACLSHHNLADLPTNGAPLDYALLRAVSRSGLCESDETKPFTFSHRLIAEYLAGRRLAKLPLHQSRALLASPTGWQDGVAGPLRETAAVASGLNFEVARWIAETDPEVIGLSEVSNDATRRTATLALLDLCRRHCITDMQLSRGGIKISGLRFAAAESVLRPVLLERQSGCEDVLDCAIRMVREWELSDLYADLTDLANDQDAPIESRKDAAHAICALAGPDLRAQIIPLITDAPDVSDEELKGIALQSNWPENLSGEEVLAALTPRQRKSFHGSYASFLWRLVEEGFDAADCRREGLEWAGQQFADFEDDYDAPFKIAQKIVHSALHRLDDEAIADLIIEILKRSSQEYRKCPLLPIENHSLSCTPSDAALAPLEAEPEIRRQLIDLLLSRHTDMAELRWLVHSIPCFPLAEDFGWLIQRALDESLDDDVRLRYAEFTSFTPWLDNVDCLEIWLTNRQSEPVATVLNLPLYVELGSEEAERQRQQYERIHGRGGRDDGYTLDPPPADRVVQSLSVAATQSPLSFRGVCRNLSLETRSRHYGCERFLTVTPGWNEATSDTREKVVAAAKAYLLCSENDDPARIRKVPLNAIDTTAIAAFWLVQEMDPDWLESQPDEWWSRWAWFILREQHLYLSGEPNEPKYELFRRLHSHVSGSVREEIRRLAVGTFRKQIESAQSLLSSVLQLCAPIEDPLLDRILCDRIRSQNITRYSLRDVAQFVLRRRLDDAASAISERVSKTSNCDADKEECELVIALFLERCDTHWGEVSGFLNRNPEAAQVLLAEFASGSGRRFRDEEYEFLNNTSPIVIGHLAEFLFDYYPPDSDPQHDGAHYVSRDDEARTLRDRLVSWLSDPQENEEPIYAKQRVTALRRLEVRFGSRFPWLRRPRARAEREYRLRHRKAIPVETVAAILDSHERRLIRHDTDALDGVVAAVQLLEQEVCGSGQSLRERYWNTPHGQAPTPRAEEFYSDEMRRVIRQYFARYGVVADREVQLHRRQVPVADGGEPGSEVDVLVSAPGRATSTGSAIVVPVEVKRSCNPEAKTGMKSQLVDRYLDQTGTAIGIFVVVWLDATGLNKSHRPIWPSIDVARAELNRQADEIRGTDGVEIRVVVIDLSLM
ncbi:hypothetical protein EC9_32720 [Rosistilla ulvae]|uniref:Uncharacterized protein n=1 Tax=Rosistilla ulvae TaxID=1930277 RepID=A0A517M2H7_9BACT|nr:hypothetical protein [Rosistilla ulvae]QDS89075.1 hypothetical protein EC9_32720 [Rosistilla ulvae]